MKRSCSMRLGDTNSVRPSLLLVIGVDACPEEPKPDFFFLLPAEILLCILTIFGYSEIHLLCILFSTSKNMLKYGIELIEERRSLKQITKERLAIYSSLYYPYKMAGGVFSYNSNNLHPLVCKIEEIASQMLVTHFREMKNLFEIMAVNQDSCTSEPQEIPTYISMSDLKEDEGRTKYYDTKLVCYHVGHESLVIGNIIRGYFLLAYLRIMLPGKRYTKLLKKFGADPTKMDYLYEAEVKFIERVIKNRSGHSIPEENTSWEITCLTRNTINIYPEDARNLKEGLLKYDHFADILVNLYHDALKASMDYELYMYKEERLNITCCHLDASIDSEFKLIPIRQSVISFSEDITNDGSLLHNVINEEWDFANGYKLTERVSILKLNSNESIPKLYIPIPMVETEGSPDKKINILSWTWSGIKGKDEHGVKPLTKQTRGLSIMVKSPKRYLDSLVDAMERGSTDTTEAKNTGFNLFRLYHNGSGLVWTKKAQKMAPHILEELLDLFPVDTFWCSKQDWLADLPHKIEAHANAWSLSQGPEVILA